MSRKALFALFILFTLFLSACATGTEMSLDPANPAPTHTDAGKPVSRVRVAQVGDLDTDPFATGFEIIRCEFDPDCGIYARLTLQILPSGEVAVPGIDTDTTLAMLNGALAGANVGYTVANPGSVIPADAMAGLNASELKYFQLSVRDGRVTTWANGVEGVSYPLDSLPAHIEMAEGLGLPADTDAMVAGLLAMADSYKYFEVDVAVTTPKMAPLADLRIWPERQVFADALAIEEPAWTEGDPLTADAVGACYIVVGPGEGPYNVVARVAANNGLTAAQEVSLTDELMAYRDNGGTWKVGTKVEVTCPGDVAEVVGAELGAELGTEPVSEGE